MSRHEQWEELAAGYALDALDPEDRELFVDHLTGCAQCRALVDEHALIAAQLGSIAGEPDVVAPPWSAIRDGVIGAGPRPADNVVELHRRRRAAIVLSAAAAAVAVVVGVVVWQVGGGSNTARPLASAAACRQTTGCHVVTLRTNGEPVASVLAYRDGVAVVSEGMTDAPDGSEWALWQVPHDGSPRLMTVFAGRSAQTDLQMPYADTGGFAISREPAGSTPTAPTVVVASGTVA